MSGGHPFSTDRSGAETEPVRIRTGGSLQEKKQDNLSCFLLAINVRERIRTPDTLVRSQVLYPAELHTHIQLK